MVVVSSRSHRQQIVDKMRKRCASPRERVSGSVGLKVGLISRQLADLYVHPSPGCKEWDLCAPYALLEAAGGVMTDCWGNPIVFNKRDVRAHNGVVATNGTRRQEIISVVRAFAKNSATMKMMAFGRNRPIFRSRSIDAAKVLLLWKDRASHLHDIAGRHRMIRDSVFESLTTLAA